MSLGYSCSGTLPTACTPGQYAGANSANCNNLAGTNTVASLSAQTNCGAGEVAYQSSRMVCQKCPLGFDCSQQPFQATPCGTGKYQAAGSGGCLSCQAGEFCPSQSSLPVACPSGTYQPSTLQTACIVCPAGKTCTVSAANNLGAN